MASIAKVEQSSSNDNNKHNDVRHDKDDDVRHNKDDNRHHKDNDVTKVTDLRLSEASLEIGEDDHHHHHTKSILTARSDDSTIDLFSTRADLRHIKFTVNDHYLCMIVFNLLGVSQLLCWNFVINSFVALEQVIYPGYMFSDLLGGCEHSMALIVGLIMLRYDRMNTKILNIVGIIHIFLYFLFPVVTQLFPGNENVTTAKILLCLICAAIGTCSGFLHVYAYGLSSAFPRNYGGHIASGNGLGGCYSFIIYIIFSEGVFGRSLKQQQGLLWVFFAAGSLVSLIQVIFTYVLIKKRPWVNQCIDYARMRHAVDEESAIKAYGDRRSIWQVVNDCKNPLFGVAATLGFTCWVQPALGPFGWNRSYTISSTLNGTFQLLDCFGRYIPNIVGSWIIVKRDYIWMLTLARVIIFLPLFMIPNRIPQKIGFLNSDWWLHVLMMMFTLSDAYIVPVATMYVPTCVNHPIEKGIAMECMVIGLLAFITVGIFSSSLLTA